MKIAIASDHAGYEEKERPKPLLNELGIQYEYLGGGRHTQRVEKIREIEQIELVHHARH